MCVYRLYNACRATQLVSKNTSSPPLLLVRAPGTEHKHSKQAPDKLQRFLPPKQHMVCIACTCRRAKPYSCATVMHPSNSVQAPLCKDCKRGKTSCKCIEPTLHATPAHPSGPSEIRCQSVHTYTHSNCHNNSLAAGACLLLNQRAGAVKYCSAIHALCAAYNCQCLFARRPRWRKVGGIIGKRTCCGCP
jgi:hypothetical protein